MRDVRRYWQEVREIEESLSECVWLVRPSGSEPVQVAAIVAAPLLHSKSHRIAMDQEVQDYLAAQQLKQKDAQRTILRKQGTAVIAVPSK